MTKIFKKIKKKKKNNNLMIPNTDKDIKQQEL